MAARPGLPGLLLALVLLAPAGYMPGAGGWVICPEGLPAGALDNGHAHHHEEGSPPCPFSLLTTAVAGPTVPLVAAAPPPVAPIAAVAAAPRLVPRPRPQLARAPPHAST